MRKLFFALLISLSSYLADAQEYEFTPVIDIEATEVKSQDITGTCWSFSTTSFLESEIIRLTGKHIDVSEMYNVRNTYTKKAWNYVMRQGKAQFSQGALAHDVINAVKENGLVPELAFGGFKVQDKYNHIEVESTLKAMLDNYISSRAGSLSPTWKKAVEQTLDLYIGENPEEFTYEGTTYTPQSFLEMTKLDMDDYVTITSFTHQPYYSSFILSVPDNFSNGSMYNVPLNEFMDVIDNALKNGYTVEWDTDVSEKTFSAKNGVAFIPENDNDAIKGLTEIVKEKNITANYRQQEFENYSTTDDHLMHIVGTMKDQKGNVYYKVKNSWGTNPDRVSNKGYVYVSKAYMELKSISVLVHKDALPKAIKKKLNL
ncbi:C1 family peptidase [Neptunitalea lumnitzerae]|uniref:Aminopeptidase n=1 Tax=Neptunitalea lumnitzerae TaxID=2965509 RepID=A0ABQ5MIC0_9FLAO|nr:C1 family peptidase [Neptunitalea sp. Y10]GLB49171.1 aminopeptidase [Neptunitalea sp. Y10]